jgi:hypothetical protein
LDNALGWNGIAAASQRFLNGVRRPVEEVPGQLGSIYSAILELGSFLEQDSMLRQGAGYAADPLDPEVQRDLIDLVRTAAPWLRQFPTVRDLDDQAGAFLTREELINPGAALIRKARELALVSSDDAAAVTGLLDAARRGELQGHKARTRSAHSIRNLLYVSAGLLSGFFADATAASYSEKSALINHAGTYLVSAEESVTEFLVDLPEDLRRAFVELIKAIRNHPDIFPPA